MKYILQKLLANYTLTSQQAHELLIAVSNKQYNASQVASLLTAFSMRTITVAELTGFKNAMLAAGTKVKLYADTLIDLCGTGGDGKNTFNISTLASFIVAGAGYKVAKHGNSAVSSSCGSSNVMEYLGYTFTADEGALNHQIDNTNICFLHAPLFNSAMKFVAPIRKELGIKTFFNMLGPMVNPASPTHQCVGVFNLELFRLYNYIYQKGDVSFTVLHDLMGYDEVSLTGSVKYATHSGDFIFNPLTEGFTLSPQTAIHGGNTIKQNADIFLKILQNKGTPAQQDVVLVNAAFALKTLQPTATFADCYYQAEESLISGKAFSTFNKLITLSNA